MQQLVDHVSWYDALGSVNEVDVLADMEARGCDLGSDIFVDGSRRNCRFNHHGRAFRTDLERVHDRSGDEMRVDLFAVFVIRRRDRYYVCVGFLVFGSEFDSGFHGCGEQLVETLFLEGGFASVQGCDKLFVVVCADDLYSVRRQHQCGGEAYVAESDYIYHCFVLS